ncbi:Protein DA1-related 1, partial [Cucurbita argyrosperma subsp. sororia]
MGWWTKFFKGHESQYKETYGNDRIWDQPQTSVGELAEFEQEDIDFATALSLSEEDQKVEAVIEEESHSDEDVIHSTKDESEDDEQGSIAQAEDDNQITKSQLEEDERLAKARMEEDERSAKAQHEEDEMILKFQAEEDEQLARAFQESLNIDPPPPRYIFNPNPVFYPSGYRVCAGCHTEIGYGRFLSSMEAFWHPECFRCNYCNEPITDYKFPIFSNRPYHESCYYKEQHHPRCDVCRNFIPFNSSGVIEYIKQPISSRPYCPSHEKDGTPRCCSCEQMETRDTSYLLLEDGRKLCLECSDSAIMDTHECQPLYLEIQEFYEGLNMKVEQQVPLLLVERQALNEAMEGEKNGHHHLPETRGLCLSEQTVATISKRPKIGAGYPIKDMFTEPHRLVRRCEVTAILVLYGLPRLLTGSILAHEMMHAWLRLKGYPILRPEVEEGICQVLAHTWLNSEINSISGSGVASTSSSSSPSSSSSSSSSKKGRRSDFEEKLGDFFKRQIEKNPLSAYGNGFWEGKHAVSKYGLKTTLDHIRLTGTFP